MAGQLAQAPDEAQLHVLRGLALADQGRKDDAIREGEFAVKVRPISLDADIGADIQHQPARIHIMLGEGEKSWISRNPASRWPETGSCS